MSEILQALYGFFVDELKLADWGPWLAGIGALAVIVEQVRKWYRAHQERKLSEQLAYYTAQDVADARRYYVQTQSQSVPPSEKPELRDSVRETAPIIKFFLTKALNDNGDTAKFYMVLGGSGMGKTTFMINLYHRYTSAWIKRPFDIKLFPIKDSETWEEIAEIKKSGKAQRTILLLDALDEDKAASEPGQFENRINEIISKVKTFKEVVISCRTQFVPSRDIVEGELAIPKHGPRGGYHKLNVHYIAPFSDADIDTYLRKRYGWLPFKKRKTKNDVRKLVRSSNRLMVRPMLLSYIDFLLEDKARDFSKIHNIYEVMIDKWLDREADRKPSHERTEFKEQLYQFSSEVASAIYQNFREEDRLELTKEEFERIVQQHQMKSWVQPLDHAEARSKSLLNRDKDGQPKFAHKSILEYFLARKAAADLAFAYTLNFEGMDMMATFCRELIPELIQTVFVLGGVFQMGDIQNGPVHSVELSDFEIAEYPITQRQWEAVMGANPSRFSGNPDHPVENVSWDDCQVFLKKLNELTHLNFRLPTEAEWEYAARGGGETEGFTYAGSNDPDAVAWYNKNAGGKTHPVGQKQPNELSLYDMSGNVWEWCSDWYDGYPSGAQINPKGPSSGDRRVIRGGSWGSDASSLRVADRNFDNPVDRYDNLGFRPARTP